MTSPSTRTQIVHWVIVFSLVLGLAGPQIIRTSSARAVSRKTRAFPRVAPTEMSPTAFDSGHSHSLEAPARSRLVESFARLPVRFEANEGQFDQKIKFVSRAGGYTLGLTNTEAIFLLNHPQANTGPQTEPDTKVRPYDPPIALRMKLLGSNPHATVSGRDQLPGKSNYFIGQDERQWQRDVVNYGTVTYNEAYPGVDMVCRGDSNRLEYDFVVAPGANAKAIALGFDRLKNIRIDQNGDLILRAKNGTLRQHKPVVYQEVDGDRRVVVGRYVLNPNRQVRFEIGEYDQSRPLVIDPVLSYSTYLGGSGTEFANSIAVDASGAAYLIGQTDSTNFPTASAMQPTPGGGLESFVVKLNASGQFVYSTYLGGSSDDQGYDLAVDSSGNVYLTGRTQSTNFPVVNPVQTALAGNTDTFISKLNANGDALLYSTYLGGTSYEFSPRIDIDTSGNAYVTGFTFSSDFPTVNAIQPYSGGGYDAYVTKLDPTGSSLVYSTYLGGSGSDYGTRIAVDSSGNAYVVGYTQSGDFPVANAMQSGFGGGAQDAFVTKINPGGNAFVYSTYLGGSGDDSASSVAVAMDGSVCVTGMTFSTNFPVANPTQATYGGGDNDGFVTLLNPSGTALTYSSYLGGTGSESGADVVLDTYGNAYITGNTSSGNFPLVSPLQSTFGGGVYDAYVTKLDTTTGVIAFSTFLGGNNNDFSYGIALDPAGSVYIVGSSVSTNFPTANALQTTNHGGSDGFVAKISGINFTIRGHIADAANNGISGVTVSMIGSQVTSTTTDAAGNYAVAVGPGDYTVTPAKAGYLFTPGTQSFTGLASNQTADFLGATSTISGQITDGNGNPLDALVTLSGSQSGSTNTDLAGNYVFQVAPGGTYTVTPSKSGYNFSPLNQTFTNISGDQIANFSGALRTYTIGGRISDTGGAGVSGVIVSLSGSQSATLQTDASGNYAFTNVISGGNYTVTPSPYGQTYTYNFTPASLSFNNLAADQTANFSSTAAALVTLYPTGDAYVQDGSSANTNFGTASLLNLKTDSGTNNGLNRDVYFKFDLGGVSTSISSVKLRIYAALSAAGSVSSSAYSVATTSWIETGTGSITWNNKPARSGSALTGATVTINSTTYTTYDLDVTSYVKGEKLAGRDVVSLALHDGAASTPTITLNSRESLANQPQLILTTSGTDNAPPAVTLTAPTNGSSFTSPANLTVSANATDSDGQIRKVDFYAGTALIGTATTPVGSTYSVTWSGVGAGAYSLSAIATDSGGAAVVSNTANIVVNAPNTPPTVTLTSPANNATFLAGSNIPLAADANDIDGAITKVEFFYGGTNKIGESLTAPYGITWNNVAAASYSLTAKATDNSGAVVTSTAINITVATPATNGEIGFVTGKTLGTLRNNLSNFAGMKLTVGAEALSVMELGRIFVSGNTGTHTLKLVKASDGTDIPGSSISLAMTGGTAGQFKYVTLPAPVLLLANTAYYVVSQETSGGDQWYDSNTSLTVTSAATVNSGIFRNGTTWTTGGTTNNSFLPVDFKYVVASATYRLHKEASTTTNLFQLKPVGPDGTALAIKTSELKSQATGEKIIKEFDTQAGVP